MRSLHIQSLFIDVVEFGNRVVLLLNMVYFNCCHSHKELRTKEINWDNVIQLGRAVPSNPIDPSRVTELSWRPRSSTPIHKIMLFVSLVHDLQPLPSPLGTSLKLIITIKNPFFCLI
ncbi:hypothetical protein Hanom_Chr15g01409441 [Helianthus anomalus]